MIYPKSLAILFFYLFTLFLSGCSAQLNKLETPLPSKQTYAITQFWNYTQTPMAGSRAASIVQGVYTAQGVPVVSLIQGSQNFQEPPSRADFLNQQKKRAQAVDATYLITGEVQEWRYKTGIDGEPVVSYSVEIIHLKDNNVVFRGVGAKSGWGHKSIGVIAQEIAQELTPNFTP